MTTMPQIYQEKNPAIDFSFVTQLIRYSFSIQTCQCQGTVQVLDMQNNQEKGAETALGVGRLWTTINGTNPR
jgi:hypothetical protein